MQNSQCFKKLTKHTTVVEGSGKNNLQVEPLYGISLVP